MNATLISAASPSFLKGRGQDSSPPPLCDNRMVTSMQVRGSSRSLAPSHQMLNILTPRQPQEKTLQVKEETVGGIEGENDFSGRQWVWVRDSRVAFVRGYVVETQSNGRLLVACDDGSQREVESESADKVNPAKFDKAGDMAELTHLNEASVVHNLNMRYQTDLIYTYSGLFLVTVNPYHPLPIYTHEYIAKYKGRSREDTKPHIYAMADGAFRKLVAESKSQSILVTGESGAGKTENTKKVIQYLAAVATSVSSDVNAESHKTSNLSQQILHANPILEAFGNAQTVRNNNSSRFGKFIRIGFNATGQITGASVDWYLLEKSRVVSLNTSERNYHIFYQLLRGASPSMRAQFLLNELGVEDFAYTRDGNDEIAGVSDLDEWKLLLKAFSIMQFSEQEQTDILRTIVAILFLGNIVVVKEFVRADQATLIEGARSQAEKACQLLGVPIDAFLQGLLHPKVKAGKEWVEKVQTPEQVRSSLDGLSKSIYERAFGDLVSKINRQLDQGGTGRDDSHFIGVLDIAGFEIFQHNNFEQLCINYTNEKLQQFFNHHMFVLEQEEYAREQIEWQFIDFGVDLQPTIDLIELPNPVGVFSCLDEDSVMPKATDKTFTDKLHALWERKTPKYQASRLTQGFILTHYAAAVEYSTVGWLEKNKDPLNDNVTRLFASSENSHVAMLFGDCVDPAARDELDRPRVRKGLFRTVAQRHKEQLSSLMSQLHATHPHFVRCILPNHRKRPKEFSAPLVLDQLRCNGVLEGIRIARTGFPNRLAFAEFRQRYEVLCGDMLQNHLEGQAAARLILSRLALDKTLYRVGLTKLFFRAGILAELEEQRDKLIQMIMSRFQSLARGFTQRRIVNKRLYRAEAVRIIQHNFAVYHNLCKSPWWFIFRRTRPLLGPTRTAREVKEKDAIIQELENKMRSQVTFRLKMEEERRRADLEARDIQHTLDSERRLALDKEEIFRRLQGRENELTEKLTGAIRDQEHLEEQLDNLIDTNRKAEEQADTRRMQLEQAGHIIARLELDKSGLAEQVGRLQMQILEMDRNRLSDNARLESLYQQNEKISNQLQLQQSKARELEAKLLESEQDSDIRLDSNTKELHASYAQVKELLDQNRSVRQQLQEVSSTSIAYEDLMRRKDSEITVLKADGMRHCKEREKLEADNASFASRHSEMQGLLRDMQAQADATICQRTQLEREINDTRKMLDVKLSKDLQAEASQKLLDGQIKDLREELYFVQADLSRERQSRDDIRMLHDHQTATLKDEYKLLNESKVVIEKELYVQQDTLRRALEAKNSAEKGRKDLQEDLKSMRERYTKTESLRIEAETVAEKKVSQQAQNRISALHKELETQSKRLDHVESERTRLFDEVQSLNKVVANSQEFHKHDDQHKSRLDCELVTIKGRLAASENDNKALMNKIQQKNLEIARTHSQVSESHRSRIGQMISERARMDKENKISTSQLNEAQITIASLNKQKERLALNVEDLTHEVERERKFTRSTERKASVLHTQLSEAYHNLDSERQTKIQIQADVKKVQGDHNGAQLELEESRRQLLLLQKIMDPEAQNINSTWNSLAAHLLDYRTMLEQLQARNISLRLAEGAKPCAESRHLQSDRCDGHLPEPKRNVLQELEQSERNMLPSRKDFKQVQRSPGLKTFSRAYPPGRRDSSNEARRDVPWSTPTLHDDSPLLTENWKDSSNMSHTIELQRRQLQGQTNRLKHERDLWQGDESSAKRASKLDKENKRLHSELDDTAKQFSALEKALRTDSLSVNDVEARSSRELFELINSQENARKSLDDVYVANLAELRDQLDNAQQDRAAIEIELQDTRSRLEKAIAASEQESADRSHLMHDHSDLRIRCDAESTRNADLESSLHLYKKRADEYFSKLEQAEIAILKATRAEQHARSQAQESDESCMSIMSQRQQIDSLVEDLQRQNQSNEEKAEDLAAELDSALQAKKRLQHELEDYRSQRAIDVEDKETSVEQTRRKYQSEFSALTSELEIERDNVIHARSENTHIRNELEELRSKWDDEILNSSAWAKEKSRLENTLEDVSNAREDAVIAHDNAQSTIVSLLSQVRDLRTSMDDTTAERDTLQKDKRSLESRLSEAGDRLEELVRGGSPSIRNAAGMDRELLDLKTSLAQQEDIATAAVGKMRRAEALNMEMQKDITTVRDNNVMLHKEKAALEKAIKDLQGSVVNLETKGYTVASQDVRFLNSRVKELENQLETQEHQHVSSLRSVRNVDRTVRDLQAQLVRRDKSSQQLQDDVAKSRDRMGRLLSQIDELQAEEAKSQLQARRAERDLREEREKALRLERELEGWKSLRVDRNTKSIAHEASGNRADQAYGAAEGIRQGIRRISSHSKGFL